MRFSVDVVVHQQVETFLANVWVSLTACMLETGMLQETADFKSLERRIVLKLDDVQNYAQTF